MNKKKIITALVTFVMVVLLAGTALAHSLFFQCWNNEDGTISCEGGYTDGAAATGAMVNVTDSNGVILFSGKLDAAGELKFNKPSGDFLVILEGGPGHTVTISSKEMK